MATLSGCADVDVELVEMDGECRTPIRPAQHGDASGVRGAAWLWPL